MKDAFVWTMVLLLGVDFTLRALAAKKSKVSTGELIALSTNGGMLLFGLTVALT